MGNSVLSHPLCGGKSAVKDAPQPHQDWQKPTARCGTCTPDPTKHGKDLEGGRRSAGGDDTNLAPTTPPQRSPRGGGLGAGGGGSTAEIHDSKDKVGHEVERRTSGGGERMLLRLCSPWRTYVITEGVYAEMDYLVSE